jgi:carboxymethylenebutenolidase
MVHRIETVTVKGSPMEVFVYEPKGAGPHPGMIVCQHIPVGHTGIENDKFTQAVCQRYADNGYVVAAPFIFHWWPKSAEMDLKRNEFRDDWTIPDLQAAYDLLAGMKSVDAKRVGIVGHCWGGRVSWVGAMSNPKLAACGIFYGGRIRLALAGSNPPAIERAKDIKCPVIGFFGSLDQNPSPADVDAYDAALTKAGVEHVFHRYDGANHAFQDNFAQKYHPEASEDAWKKALAFFEAKLKKPAAVTAK